MGIAVFCGYFNAILKAAWWWIAAKRCVFVKLLCSFSVAEWRLEGGFCPHFLCIWVAITTVYTCFFSRELAELGGVLRYIWSFFDFNLFRELFYTIRGRQKRIKICIRSCCPNELFWPREDRDTFSGSRSHIFKPLLRQRAMALGSCKLDFFGHSLTRSRWGELLFFALFLFFWQVWIYLDPFWFFSQTIRKL